MDWNGNGEHDAFDDAMDYMVYQDIHGNGADNQSGKDGNSGGSGSAGCGIVMIILVGLFFLQCCSAILH